MGCSLIMCAKYASWCFLLTAPLLISPTSVYKLITTFRDSTTATMMWNKIYFHCLETGFQEWKPYVSLSKRNRDWGKLNVYDNITKIKHWELQYSIISKMKDVRNHTGQTRIATLQIPNSQDKKILHNLCQKRGNPNCPDASLLRGDETEFCKTSSTHLS